MDISTWYKIVLWIIISCFSILIALGIYDELNGKKVFDDPFIMFVTILCLVITVLIILMLKANKNHKYYISMDLMYLELSLPAKYVKCRWDEIESITSGAFSIRGTYTTYLCIKVKKECDTIRVSPIGWILWGGKRGFVINDVLFKNVNMELLQNTLSHYVHRKEKSVFRLDDFDNREPQYRLRSRTASYLVSILCSMCVIIIAGLIEGYLRWNGIYVACFISLGASFIVCCIFYYFKGDAPFDLRLRLASGIISACSEFAAVGGYVIFSYYMKTIDRFFYVYKVFFTDLAFIKHNGLQLPMIEILCFFIGVGMIDSKKNLYKSKT